MNDEKVFRLLMETNPVPDPDGLDSPLALAELERRSPIMATDQPSSGNRSNGLLIGAVAAVAVLIVGLGSWAVLANDDGSGATTTAAVAATSTTSSPTSTALPAEAESLALATVAAYYDALNRGDYPAMLEVRTEAWRAPTGESTYRAIVAAANERAVVVEPCNVVSLSAEDRRVVKCTISYSNDYHGPADIDYGEPRVETLLVTKDGKIDGMYDDHVSPPESDPASFGAYNRAFYDWLEVAYPDVYEEIKVDDGESIPGWFAQDPGHMTIAIEYIEEFVAQSDVYPLERNDGG